MTKSDSLAGVRKRLSAFAEERDWGQFHSPRNLAAASNYALQLAERLGVDLLEETDRKIDRNAARYTVEKAKGRIDKYTDI